MAWVAASKERAWNAPIPPLVQQFCALRLPEQLLERVSKRDAPADNLERTLDVMSQLSLCKCAQVGPDCFAHKVLGAAVAWI